MLIFNHQLMEVKGKPLSYLPEGERIPSGWIKLLPFGEAGERLKGTIHGITRLIPNRQSLPNP